MNNVALYCKNWYKTRDGGVKTMWMDLAHCINADGWCPQTKKDVAFWCLDALDELRGDKLFKRESKLGLYSFFSEMDKTKRLHNMFNKDELDMYDLIILNFRDIIFGCDNECFDEYTKPSPEVLPLNFSPAYYSNFSKLYRPAEMMCDYMKKVDNIFPDAKDNSLTYYPGFELVESNLHIDNWEDVLVINGSDNLNDCKEIYLTGLDLNDGVTADGEHAIDLNIYSHVKNFLNTQVYTCRVKPDGYNGYKLMSVKYE